MTELAVFLDSQGSAGRNMVGGVDKGNQANPDRTSVAVVGGGISGMSAAWLLRNRCNVMLFEMNHRLGGHSNTVTFDRSGQTWNVDTGFIVYNDRTYPNFMKLLKQLDVEGVPTEMSFAVRCDSSGTEYCGSSLSGLFAQRSNLIRPRFLRMVADILRFNRIGTAEAESVDEGMTVGEYLRKHRLGKEFADLYLLPMGAAIWSCPTGTFADFPIRFILEFYRNHGLLSITNRPQWYTIPGGSRRYVERITSELGSRVAVDSCVKAVQRFPDHVKVWTASPNGELREQIFDEVIFACHSDQAMKLIQDATAAEKEILAAFPYEPNEAILHTDESVLPRRRNAWAAWNYRITGDSMARPTVTYNMNILQHLKSAETFSVTLNDSGSIHPDRIIRRQEYFHPVFTLDRGRMQSRHAELIRSNRTSYCGAYWGNGFHEDGVVSALAVAREFGVPSLDDAASVRPLQVQRSTGQGVRDSDERREVVHA